MELSSTSVYGNRYVFIVLVHNLYKPTCVHMCMKLKVFITCSWVLLEMENVVLHENSITEYKGTCTHICEHFLIYKKPAKHIISFRFVIFSIYGKLFNRKCEGHVFN